MNKNMNIYKFLLTKMYIYYFNAIAQKQIIDNSFFFANKKSILPIYGIYFYIKNFKIINDKLKQKF